jgi:transposase-like protein
MEHGTVFSKLLCPHCGKIQRKSNGELSEKDEDFSCEFCNKNFAYFKIICKDRYTHDNVVRYAIGMREEVAELIP